MKYNFDKLPNRRHTYSLKWDVEDNVLPMWVADMDFEVAPCIKKAIQRRVDIGAYGYSNIPDEFFLAIQNWWKRRYNYVFDTKDMIYSSGIVAAISSMVRKLTTVGENVLIQSPTYNIFYNSIYNNGRNIVSNDLVYENGNYHIDFDDLENKMKDPQTTLMILCNPHNPIGKIWTKEELAKIGFLAKKYGVIVISDEIHCDLTTPGKRYIPFASVNEVNKDVCVTCVAPSKTFNLAGLQSACIIASNPLIHHHVWRGLNTDEVAEPNFFSMEADIAAYNEGEDWADELIEYIHQNKLLVKEYLEKNLPRLHLVLGEATYLVWIDVSSYTNDSVSLVSYIKNETGLFLNEGLEYGKNGNNFVRMNLGTSKANVLDGLNRLKEALDKFDTTRA
jgi:cystathionine beta-lyase